MLYPALVAATNAQAATDSSYNIIDDPGIIELGWKICIPSLAEAQVLAESGVAVPDSAVLSIGDWAKYLPPI